MPTAADQLDGTTSSKPEKDLSLAHQLGIALRSLSYVSDGPPAEVVELTTDRALSNLEGILDDT